MNGFSHSKADFDYFYTDMAKKMYKNKIASSILFDYRGHGDSWGSINDISLDMLVEDVTTVILYAVEELKVSQIYIWGIGIAGVLLDKLLKSKEYKNLNSFIKKIFLFSPAMDCINTFCFEDYSHSVEISKYVNHESYDLFYDYNNEIILWFANLGCAIENVLGIKINKDLLMNLNKSINEINYSKFDTNTVIILFQDDPRFVIKQYEGNNNTIYISGSGVLAIDPITKDSLFDIVCLNI